ncbi:polysaccharide pyruvyl transferase family protein [Candidatus Sumerlaeota bacterium]|nr:polysaccharide pyruvyl transferase family protein [Candidatus Sumerlaeota bacterium]
MTQDPKKIFVTGMTSLHPYAMEFENLGNFVIVEPFFRTLKEEFLTSSITTSLQLTDDYSQYVDINVLRDKSLWTFGYKGLLRCCIDFLCALAWFIAKRIFRIDLKMLRMCSPRLKALSDAELVIDFSGDMYGDNAQSIRHFLIWSMAILIARLMEKKICFVASSPGPFRSTFRLLVARFVLKQCDLVAVREPLSHHNLNHIGLSGAKFVWFPCPSVGFRPLQTMSVNEIRTREPKITADDKPLVGLILCNINMSEPPLYKWPREDWEYEPFIRIVEALVKRLEVRVCVMSHQNRTDSDCNFIPSPDHKLVGRLVELIPQEIANDVFTINGLYNASGNNFIISHFSMLISGRIHGAMQGISQCIPTAIIDYGMEPKAHKLKGFAMMCGLDDYICDPADTDMMIERIKSLWKNRQSVHAQLSERIPTLEKQSRELWKRVRREWERRL